MNPILQPEIRETPGASQPPAESRGAVVGGISLVLNALSLMVAFILVVVLFFTWQSVADLTELEKRLGELTEFEKRIVIKLDTVNQGVHSQFDELTRRVSQLSGEVGRLETELAGVRQGLERLAQDASAFPGEPAPVISSAETEMPQAGDDVPAAPEPSQTPTAAGRPAGSPGFQRSETPDGKVTYSKIR